MGNFYELRSGKYLIPPWRPILKSYYYKFYHITVDQLVDTYDYYQDKLKILILNEDFNVVLDFVSHVLGHNVCPESLAGSMDKVFKNHLAPYRVVDAKFVAPTTSEYEAETLVRAFEELKEGGFGGAHEHLRKAVDCLNNSQPDYAGCVRESIHAVESVVRRIDQKKNKTFDGAMKSLKPHINIHPALEAGVRKIYGYSSDEEGIRHSLINPPATVDLAEALFMLGACASFVTYLISKARDAGLVKD